MKLRFAQPEEKEQFTQWAERNKARNAFDPDIFGYPMLQTYCAFNGKVVAYMPVHPVLVMDSVAPNPEAEARDLHDALESMLEAAEKCARMSGMGEVMFLASDERVARAAERRGFRESGMRLMRKKVLK